MEEVRVPYFGDFVLFRKLGRGGMGVVYEAQQASLNRPVALKILDTRFGASKEAVQRLRVEAETASRLDHPGIVRIYEIGEHEGHPFLAMQLVEGESLAELIGKGPVEPREAARITAKAARAMHHAHQRGVLHRDLKPANIILDQLGEPHLIDFGLAKCLEEESGLTITGEFLGTPSYVSPEQAMGQPKLVTTSSDIYSLGAVLYALITGRPPFEGRSAGAILESVRRDQPVKLKIKVPAVMPDLETICLKCLEKEPGGRYASASELAEDLERFLDGRPISGRQVGKVERAWLWLRRNPVKSVSYAAVILAFVGLLCLWITSLIRARSQSELARNQSEHGRLLAEIERIRLTPRFGGWFDQSWALASNAAHIAITLPRKDTRDQTAALLAGLDAHLCFKDSGASALAFSGDSKKLLMSGAGFPTRIWNVDSGRVSTLVETNDGEVAFSADGSPVQLIDEDNAVALRDLLKQQVRSRFVLPLENGVGEPALFETMTHDGSYFACVLRYSNNPAKVTVWHTEPLQKLGSFLVQLPASPIRPEAHLLEGCCWGLSPDGSLVALSSPAGAISVWDVAAATNILSLPGQGQRLNCLTFGRNTRARPDAGNFQKWLLAEGAMGGSVTVWDLSGAQPPLKILGSAWETYKVAFSPNGMILASTGRDEVKLWDLASGELLLRLPACDFVYDLVFSPDGRSLAAGGPARFSPGAVFVWNLEIARGMETLRGLFGNVVKVCYSPDRRLVAALSQNWEIGVWDRTRPALLHVLQAGVGVTADNSALLFSSDARQLFCSAGMEAKCWDTATGEELSSLRLPLGVQDLLTIHPSGMVLLFRSETKLNKQDRDGNFPSWTEDPRVCRVRELPSGKILYEIERFNQTIYATIATHNGAIVVVEGASNRNNWTTYSVEAFDALSGNSLWSFPESAKKPGREATVMTDMDGTFVHLLSDGTNAVFLQLSTGMELPERPWFAMPVAIGPRGDTWLENATKQQNRSFSLRQRGKQSPLVVVGIDSVHSNPGPLSRDGNLFSWGNEDGSVTICDFPEIRRQLSQLGLSW